MIFFIQLQSHFSILLNVILKNSSFLKMLNKASSTGSISEIPLSKHEPTTYSYRGPAIHGFLGEPQQFFLISNNVPLRTYNSFTGHTTSL